MKYRICPLCAFILGLALLAGCSPARTGLTGSTLTTNTRPAISITAAMPLQPVDSGALWVQVPNDTEILSSAMASFNYAVFGDGNTSGPVTRHAHAILSRLENSSSWNFAPDTWKAPNAFTSPVLSNHMSLGGYAWQSQLLRVPSEGDWFSDLWAANGRTVPEVWLAKRWTDLLDNSNKAVLEYREPWPDCLQVVSPDLMLISGDAASCLSAFNRRADKAFATSAQNTPLDNRAPAQRFRAQLDRLPDVRKLVGEAIAVGYRSGGGSRD